MGKRRLEAVGVDGAYDSKCRDCRAGEEVDVFMVLGGLCVGRLGGFVGRAVA